MFVNRDNGKICFEEGDVVCVSKEGIDRICVVKEAYDPDDDHGINHYNLESGETIAEWDIYYDKTVKVSMIQNKC